jgi:hypothetical protein
VWSRKLPQVEREVELGAAPAVPIEIVIAGDR